MYKTRKLFLLCLAALQTVISSGQVDVTSPFARYGIGNLELQGTIRTLAMGGVSSGIRSNTTLNFLTPASYSAIDTASFIFDFAIDVAGVKLVDNENTFYSSNMNFRHILMGFPIMKNWGVSTGLLPFTNAYYTIVDRSTLEGGSGDDEDIFEQHKGIGGYQKFYLGSAFSPVKYFSAGINMFLVFGEINRYNDFIFLADNNYFNTRKLENQLLNGISYEASAQFMIPLKKERSVNIGITYSPEYNLKTVYDDILIRYSNLQSSSLAFDTLYFYKTDTTSILPRSIRGGISFNKSEKLTIAADIVYSAWSGASLPGSYGTYSDAISVHAGVEFIPDKYSNYSFFNRIEYRIGGRYSESYALYNGMQVKEYGITFGAGIPMRRSRSRASFFVDLSTKGSIEETYFKETRLAVGASLSLFDFWFLKPKYD
ncbi:MAG: hypothetical protein MUC78_05720 [Bacteroidales bacterium]|jgi:hypothetical protein|nr:hypothetical protein [Bacteroidales bacterium]MCU0410717.1 hypothetical protein [Bacteroidales bacterium]